jgi:hypothetical protein
LGFIGDRPFAANSLAITIQSSVVLSCGLFYIDGRICDLGKKFRQLDNLVSNRHRIVNDSVNPSAYIAISGRFSSDVDLGDGL